MIFNNNNGFTLIEVLVSLVISGIILMASVSLMVSTASVEGDSIKASQQIDLVMTLNGVRDKLSNVTKLYPSHDLYDPEDKLYYGLSDIRGENLLKDICHEGHALIYTLTDTTKSPTKTLRYWNEGNLNAPGISKTLVTQFDEGENFSSSFKAFETLQTNEPPKELIAIDADGKIKRNYLINKIVNYTSPQVSDSITNEPYADPHVAITVEAPRTLKSNQAADINSLASFLTGSLLYPSNTFYVCLEKDTKHLIEGYLYKPNLKKTLMMSGQSRTNLTSLNFEFIGTRPDKKINVIDYFTDLPLAKSVISAVTTKQNTSEYEIQTTRECVNIVRLTLMAELVSNKQGGRSEIIKNQKTVFINNFMPDRPVKCQAAQ